MTEYARLSECLQDIRCAYLVGLVGIPYSWGAGTPQTPFPAAFYDCSGFVQGVWVYLAMLDPHAPDRSAMGLADICDPIPASEARLGDIAVYPGHVMLCMGHGWVIGASGGTSRTHGDDPRAYVKVQRVKYRSDFICCGRLKPEHHV